MFSRSPELEIIIFGSFVLPNLESLEKTFNAIGFMLDVKKKYSIKR
jgi:hypothetical protein